MDDFCYLLYPTYVDRENSVGIAAHHRLDCPEIESRWGKDFPQASRPARRPKQCVPGVLLRGKVTGE